MNSNTFKIDEDISIFLRNTQAEHFNILMKLPTYTLIYTAGGWASYPVDRQNWDHEPEVFTKQNLQERYFEIAREARYDPLHAQATSLQVVIANDYNS